MTTATEYAFEGEHNAIPKHVPDDLTGLMSGVLARFDEADRRNEALLREMHGQIEALRAEARHTRPSVPEQYRPGFERIEDGMTLLASKLAETCAPRPLSSEAPDAPIANAFAARPVPELQSIEQAFAAPAPLSAGDTSQMNQAPLMSAAGPAARSRFSKPAAHGDTFDVIESVPGDPAEPWTAEEVAALNEIYSTRDMLFAPVEPSRPSEASARVHETAPSTDRDWIDGRLTEIARLIVEARPHAAPDQAISALSERFDTLERHLTEALRGIARVEDFGSLQQIESHICDLTAKVEQVHAELTRIDALDSRLGSIEQHAAAAAQAPGQHAEIELHAVAIAAAEAAAGRVAQQVTRDQQRPQGPDRVSEVHDMLASFMAERRQGDEQTAAILDTLQQAMVHLLDRVDTRPEMTAPAHASVDAPKVTDFADDAMEPEIQAATLAVEPASPDSTDPISRQRASLQMSAQRAAQAQRDKQAAGEAAARSKGAKPADTPAEKRKATGWRRLMVRGMVLAISLGAGVGTMTALMPSPSPVSTVQLKSAVSPTAAESGTLNGQSTQASISGQISQPAETVSSSVSSVITNDKPSPTAMTGILIQDQPPQVGASAASSGSSTKVSANAADSSPDAALDEDQQKTALGLPPLGVGPLSLRLAAGNGDPSAEFEVASRLAEGKGADQNLSLAARWYHRSASKGFVQSQYRLGTLYERGLGVSKDLNRAKVWYQRAAEQGNVKSMHNLAVLAAGRTGAAPDYVTAAKWFALAAQNGLADSQFNLAVLTESGLGVAKDKVVAAEWYTIAARSGDRESIRRRDALRTQLSKPDLARADAFVQTWQPLVPDHLANDSMAAGQVWKQRQQGAQDAADNG